MKGRTPHHGTWAVNGPRAARARARGARGGGDRASGALAARAAAGTAAGPAAGAQPRPPPARPCRRRPRPPEGARPGRLHVVARGVYDPLDPRPTTEAAATHCHIRYDIRYSHRRPGQLLMELPGTPRRGRYVTAVDIAQSLKTVDRTRSDHDRRHPHGATARTRSVSASGLHRTPETRDPPTHPRLQ